MANKNQFSTLEESKLLKELGVEQRNTLFKHVNDTGYESEWEIVHTEGYGWLDFPCYSGYNHQYAAYTPSELYRMLPEWIIHNGVEYRLKRWKNEYQVSDKVMYCCCYDEWKTFGEPYRRIPSLSIERQGDYFDSESEASSLAQMLIYILKEDIVTVEQINKRAL